MKNIVKKVKRFFSLKVKPFLMNNNKRNLKICIVSLVSLLVIAGTLITFFIYNKLGLINSGDEGIDFSDSDASYVDDSDHDFEIIHDVGDYDSLNSLLKQWATNGGEKMSSKNVVNILLCGVDSTDGTMAGARSDAIMIVSANRATEKITLVSILRDSYTYMDINGSERYRKINAVYNWGGPGTLLETIENNYKIEIDGYVSVDFKSFPKLIDALGGVTVDVEKYEAAYINNHSKGFIAYEPTRKFPKGKNVLLEGQEALIFSRIRKCDSDSDISRTRRQRSVIMALIKSAEDASTTQLNNAMNAVFPHIRTSFSKPDLLSLGTKAITQAWANYDIVQIVTPDTDAGNTGKSASINGEFVWVVDYAKSAKIVQDALYGKSNIELDNEDERKAPLDLLITKKNHSNKGNSSNNTPNKNTNENTSTDSGDNIIPTTPGNKDTSKPTNSNGSDNNTPTNPKNGGGDNPTSSNGNDTPTPTKPIGEIGAQPDLDIGDVA